MLADISLFNQLQANAHAAMGYSGLGVFNDTAVVNATFDKNRDQMTKEQRGLKAEMDNIEAIDADNYSVLKNLTGENATGTNGFRDEIPENNRKAYAEYAKQFFQQYKLFKKDHDKMEKLNVNLTKSERAAFNELIFIGDMASRNPNTQKEKAEAQELLNTILAVIQSKTGTT